MNAGSTSISQNSRHYLAVFDDPGCIFPDFFDGPGFFDISGVEEVSIDVSGLLEEWKSNDGKTKGGASGLGAFVGIYECSTHLYFILSSSIIYII